MTSDIMKICFWAMGFTIQDRCGCSSANIDNVKGLALSQEQKPQTHSGKVHDLAHISDFSHQDYQEWSASEVHVGPLQVPGSRLIVPVSSVLFIRIFSSNNVPSFLRKLLTEVYSSITFAISQLLMKYLSCQLPLVAEEIYMMPELHYRYQTIFILQFNNFT